MKNQGFSIVSTLAVLLIIAFISKASIDAYNKQMVELQSGEVKDDFLTIKNAVINHYIDEVSYEGLTTEYAFSQGIFPASAKMSFSTRDRRCFTRLGLECGVGILTDGTKPSYLENTSGFEISMDDVPINYCFALVFELSKYFVHVDMGSETFKSRSVSFNGTKAAQTCNEFRKKGEGSHQVRVAHY